MDIRAEYTRLFPSPHGDKFQHGGWTFASYNTEFPSPHGDKFQHNLSFEFQFLSGFPSPHGDKFQLPRIAQKALPRLFPSPHGDKFQQLNLRFLISFSYTVYHIRSFLHSKTNLFYRSFFVSMRKSGQKPGANPIFLSVSRPCLGPLRTYSLCAIWSPHRS